MQPSVRTYRDGANGVNITFRADRIVKTRSIGMRQRVTVMLQDGLAWEGERPHLSARLPRSFGRGGSRPAMLRGRACGALGDGLEAGISLSGTSARTHRRPARDLANALDAVRRGRQDAMRLSGALSNRPAASALSGLLARKRKIIVADEPTPSRHSMRLPQGSIQAAVMEVLAAASGSLRPGEVREKVQQCLGVAISQDTVSSFLSVACRADEPVVIRVGYGRYRIAP